MLIRKIFTTALVPAVLLLTIGNEVRAEREKTNFAFEEKTILQLQDALKSGEITSKKLVELFISRIKKLDPELNSIIETNPDAIRIAEQMDKERASGRVRSLMHGIPVLLKDNIDTNDKMKTTAGSLALLDAPAPKDAVVVKRLRDSGAVILGKTNMTEWASGRSKEVPVGWSARGGQTRSPYYFNLNPQGSSSGSAVATSANLTSVAIGTETGYSIVNPASANGIVGIKPSIGLVSRTGIIPLTLSQDTPGPMARNVADAFILLKAMIGEDNGDRAMSKNKDKRQSVYREFNNSIEVLLKKDGLKGKKLGFIKEEECYESDMKKLCAKIKKKLESLGAIVDVVKVRVDEVTLFNEKYDKSKNNVRAFESFTFLSRYLRRRAKGTNFKIKTIEDLIVYYKLNKTRDKKYNAHEKFTEDLKGGKVRLQNYRQQLNFIRKSIHSVYAKKLEEFDALITPTAHVAQPIGTVGKTAGDSTIQALNVGRYPHITVSGGTIEGLPVGISFIGKPYSELALIKLAYAWEQSTNCRILPLFKQKFPDEKPNLPSVQNCPFV